MKTAENYLSRRYEPVEPEDPLGCIRGVMIAAPFGLLAWGVIIYRLLH